MDRRNALQNCYLIKFLWYYAQFETDKDCRIVFNSMKTSKRDYITKNEFGLWFGTKVTGFNQFYTNKITNCMRRILNKFDTDKNQTLDFDEFSSLYF